MSQKGFNTAGRGLQIYPDLVSFRLGMNIFEGGSA